ncbi:MAG: carboxypeptidase regulatory-like domain-containing protein [Candidatus Sericytochromatia bacterium]|nr:carboxypeptidase regulatory-like domain-containing protein [Candidatus Sericytochromatia bacterium]
MKKISLAMLLTLNLTILGCNVPTTATNKNLQDNSQIQVDFITIEGTVQDPSDQPVADVNVVIKDNNKTLGNTKTDAQGKFAARVIKTFDNSYYIEANKNLLDGTFNQTLIITAGQRADFIGKDKLIKTTVASKPVPIK